MLRACSRTNSVCFGDGATGNYAQRPKNNTQRLVLEAAGAQTQRKRDEIM